MKHPATPGVDKPDVFGALILPAWLNVSYLVLCSLFMALFVFDIDWWLGITSIRAFVFSLLLVLTIVIEAAFAVLLRLFHMHVLNRLTDSLLHPILPMLQYAALGILFKYLILKELFEFDMPWALILIWPALVLSSYILPWARTRYEFIVTPASS